MILEDRTDKTRLARIWFAITAAAVILGIAIQIPVTANGTVGFFHTPFERALNVFSFFTIQSNILIAITCFMLAIKPDRSSKVFSVVRMTGLVAITITGIVYHVALSGLFELDTWGLAADQLLHTVVPVMALSGWLLFGPRRLVSSRIALFSLAFPIAWLAFTLIRGAFVPFYPYPFIDVNQLGYLKTTLNCLWVSLLFMAVAATYTRLDVVLGNQPVRK